MENSKILSQIQAIKEKLNYLKSIDDHYKLCGVQENKYQLGPVLSEAEIIAFEREYDIKLPEDYRLFLIHVGDGGAGRSHGFISLYRVLRELIRGKFPSIEELDQLLSENYFLDLQEDRELVIQNYKPEIETLLKSTSIEETDTFSLFKMLELGGVNIFEKCPSLNTYTCYGENRERVTPYFIETYKMIKEAENNWTWTGYYSTLKGYLWLYDEGCTHISILILNGDNAGKMIRTNDCDYLVYTNLNFVEDYLEWLDVSIAKVEKAISEGTYEKAKYIF